MVVGWRWGLDWKRWAEFIVMACMLRSMTAAIYAMCARRSSAAVRACSAMVVGCGMAAVAFLGQQCVAAASGLAIALPYFACICLIWQRCMGRGFPRSVTPQGAFGLAWILCVVVPVAALPAECSAWHRAYGFELVLALYSWAAEAHRVKEVRSRGDALFFLMVSPVLVVQERGERIGCPALRRRALHRIMVGVLTVGASGAIAQASAIGAAAGAWHDVIAARILLQGTALVLLHSGVASVQIGWMRLIGWDVPERYRWAVLARTPREFWQRWNTYLGSWVQRYVFVPLSLRWRRQGRQDTTGRISALAMACTFAMVGALHDLADYHAERSTTLAWTCAFGFAAVVVGVAEALHRTTARTARRTHGEGVVGGRVAVAAQFLGMGWILSRTAEQHVSDVLRAMSETMQAVQP